jgi:hypothetical protein
MKDVARMMEKVGIPGQDAYDLPSSTKTFPDGAHYRMEISGVERPKVLEAVIDEATKRDIPIHRLISQMAADANMEVILTPGPRAGWDIGRQLATPEGALSGVRCRGSKMLNQTIADIMMCIDLGFRGFLVVDEGELWLLNEMKKNGDIPEDIIFKVSIYAGHANAAGGKVLEMLGAGTFNPVADLTLPQFASIRQATDIPLDVHIIITESFGGYMRFYDAPEMARVCSPCYFKIEPGPACAATGAALYKPWVDEGMLANWGRVKVKYAQIIHEIIQENNPNLKLSDLGPDDLAIPQP